MRLVTLGELIELHRRIIAQTGGAEGIRDLGLAESALAQPQMSFGGHEMYPTLTEKAAALEELIQRHKDNWIDLAKDLFDLRGSAEEGRKDEIEGVSRKAAPFYDMVGTMAREWYRANHRTSWVAESPTSGEFELHSG